MCHSCTNAGQDSQLSHRSVFIWNTIQSWCFHSMSFGQWLRTKNSQMNTILKQLGIKHIDSNLYRPQVNSRIENVHNFLKRTLTKFLSSSDAEWDKVLPFTCYCFNSTPTSDDLESPFFLIYGKDPLKGCTGLFCSGDTRYMGEEKG